MTAHKPEKLPEMKPVKRWAVVSENGECLLDDFDLCETKYDSLENAIYDLAPGETVRRVLIVADTPENRKKLGVK